MEVLLVARSNYIRWPRH